jgi:hypothetical protein
MYWYNPTKRIMESVPAPLVDAQAIEMLSGHPDSDEFIEIYIQGLAHIIRHRRGFETHRGCVADETSRG